MKKTCLFDFDGTLVDSMPTFVSVMKEVMREYGASYDDATIKTIVPLGYQGTVEYCRQNGIDLPIDAMTRRMGELMITAYRDHIPAKANVIPLLEVLHEAGVSLNILTASPHMMLDPALRRLGVLELFDHVWSCEDFATTKSDPEIYRRAAEKMGVDVRDVWFFDDNIHALSTAKQVGMHPCGVFDAASAEDEAAIRALAELYLSDAGELLSLLGGKL